MTLPQLRHYLRKRGSLILPGIVALLAIFALQISGVHALDRVSLQLFDTYQRAKPRPYQDAGVKIVDIDDETIRRLGQWPWPRTDIAALTKRLADAGAATVAFDIAFSEPDRTSPARLIERARRDGASPAAIAGLQSLPDNDAAFAKTLATTPSVLAFFLTNDGTARAVPPKAGIAVGGSPPGDAVTRYTNAIQPLPALRDAASGDGFISLKGDSDGIVRKAPLIAFQGDQLMPSLSAEALRVAQGAGSLIVKTSDASGEYGGGGDVASLKIGAREVPTTRAGELYVYYTAPQPQRVMPAWKILTGQLSDAQMADQFGGRIVLVGSGAIGLRDTISTPLQDRELGVMVHAQAIEQMVTQQFLVQPDWGPGLERALTLALGLLLALALPWIGAVRGAALGLVAIGGIMAGSWEAFSRDHFLLDPTYPVIALLAVYLVETGVTYWREERQRAYIHGAFDRYLSPDLVKRIVDDPGQLELGGEEREMTVLFCDIRSFSRISESLTPHQIIRFLIAFLTPMCDVLLARKATVDKFIGDAILAFWNAPLDDPDQHANAARGALQMLGKLDGLNRTMPGTGEPWPSEVRIGIGLNAGPCCVGNMGSAQRLSYTLIGDTVNLASRLEGLTKYYGVKILIGSALREKLPGFATLPVDCVRVVGRDACETVFTLLGDEALAADPAYRSFAANHAAMFAAYQAQDWEQATALLTQEKATAARFGLEKLYGLIGDRILAFRAAPPGPDWDGVFEAKEK